MLINFKQIPNQTRLFLDYLYNFENLSDYYAGNYQSDNDWKKRIEIVKNRSMDRQTIASALREGNREYGCNEQTLQNIDKLEKENALAVVTGQQMGLFMGPLYTLYKTMATIKLAKTLEKRFQHPFVPMFWLENEDHDFDEVNHVYLLDLKNEITRLTYNHDPGGKHRKPVGKVILDETIDDIFNQLNEITPHSEFKTDILGNLRESYSIGKTFADGFAHFMLQLFRSSGLILVDPRHPKFKKIVAPVYYKEIDECHHSSKLLHTQNQKLIEDGYHAQVSTDPTNVFLLKDDERFLIQSHQDEFQLKGNGTKYTKDELFKILEETPRRFIPNVVMRPLVQDSICPTLAYIAGPSEVAYFAQFKTLYKFFDIPMPIIYPRTSITLIEKKIEKVIRKYDLAVPDFFSPENNLIERVIKQQSDIELDRIFQGSSAQLNHIFTELDSPLKRIDPTLKSAIKQSKSKMEYQLTNLRQKAMEAEKRKHATIVNQLTKGTHNLYPQNILQERRFNLLYYLTRYGYSFIDILENEMDINTFDHQVIHL